ncbi:MAG: glycosyltransferase family 4 protein [Bryobacteraceae bacterium]|nr:glycosyltransferase family 4 protein [Bryobacteraceae bacterium]
MRPASSIAPASPLARIVVDLTPLRPGGENGGAKPFTLELLRALAALLPETQFVLLTGAAGHDELAPLESANVNRLCIARGGNSPASSLAGRLVARGHRWEARLSSWVPSDLRRRLRLPYEAALLALNRKNLLRTLRANLLFCPFTAPTYHHPAVPTVCLVHDLQFLTYPQFFSEHDRLIRHRHFRQACSVARLLICPSHYVGARIESAAGPPPPETLVIRHAAHQRLPVVSASARLALLHRLGLQSAPFLLYPANFWLHKNHELLLTAFALFRRRNPAVPVLLVLTGSPGDRDGILRSLVQALGLNGSVLFAGFLPDEDLAALFDACLALVFPSLYEGFGMPIMEAMHRGRPVLSSDRTALREVGGDAPLYFDPRSPLSLASALESLWSQSGLAGTLARQSLAHAAAAPTLDQMAARYAAAFTHAAANLTPSGDPS